MVEFALVLPIFMALVLGMFTGGTAYNQKLSMTNAAREGSRYAATLPVSSTASMTAWLDSVAAVAVDAASGELAPGTPGRVVCVAYVYPAGTTSVTDRTTKRVQTGSAAPAYTTGPSERCFADGRPNSERRVQVALRRDTRIEAIIYSSDFTLKSSSVARFEATSS
jgi:Flp pilus assembly protein TadG